MPTTKSDFATHFCGYHCDRNRTVVVNVNSVECWAMLNNTGNRTLLGVTDKLQPNIMPLKQILGTNWEKQRACV